MTEKTLPAPHETVIEDGDELTITTNVSSVEPGAYVGTLIDLATFEYEAEEGMRRLLRWVFTLPDAEDAQVEAVSSLNTGARSKAFAFLAALMGAEAVSKPRSAFKRSELIGRKALVVVEVDDKGFAKAASLAPLPKSK